MHDIAVAVSVGLAHHRVGGQLSRVNGPRRIPVGQLGEVCGWGLLSSSEHQRVCQVLDRQRPTITVGAYGDRHAKVQRVLDLGVKARGRPIMPHDGAHSGDLTDGGSKPEAGARRAGGYAREHRRLRLRRQHPPAVERVSPVDQVGDRRVDVAGRPADRGMDRVRYVLAVPVKAPG